MDKAYDPGCARTGSWAARQAMCGNSKSHYWEVKGGLTIWWSEPQSCSGGGGDISGYLHTENSWRDVQNCWDGTAQIINQCVRSFFLPSDVVVPHFLNGGNYRYGYAYYEGGYWNVLPKREESKMVMPEEGNVTFPSGSSFGGSFIQVDLDTGKSLRKLFIHPNGTHEQFVL